MQDTLVYVGCGQNKRDEKSYAWRLYEKDYHDKKMTVSMLAGQPAVLSAEHGHLPVTERVEPYDTKLDRDLTKDERNEWGKDVAESIPSHIERVMFLASKTYRNNVIPHLADDIEVINPFASDELNGIGDQIGWLKRAAERLERGEDLDEVLP